MNFNQINRSAMSPLLAFPAIWILGALLSQIHLFHAQSTWSTVVISAVCAVPISFVAGGLLGESAAIRWTPLSSSRERATGDARTMRIVLVAMVVLGFAELLHQFARAGSIPLLSGNIDQARFGQGGPTILLTDLLTAAAIIALTVPKNLFAREHRFELGIAVAALGGFALQAGRGAVLLPIVVAIAARWLYWGRPRTSLLFGGGMLTLAVVALLFFVRAEQHPTTPFEAELFGEVLPTLPLLVKPLIPLYLAITTNFLALQAVVGHFPTVAPFGHGTFDALGINYFIPSARDLGGISAQLTPPWVTSTVAGPFWADGGFPVLILGIAATGALSAGAYVAARRTRSLRWSMVAAFLLYLAVFGIYTSLWTQHVDWLVVTPVLLVLGAVIEDPASPPGATGRALGRISRRFKSASAPKGSGDKDPKPIWKLIGAGLATIGVLIVLGEIVQSTLPEPYPKAETIRLPPSVATADAVMTDSDRRSENSSLWWVNRHGQELALRRLDLSYSSPRLKETHLRLPPSFGDVQYDIGAWPPLRDPALFIMRQEQRNLIILIKSARTGKTVDRFRSPIPAPLPGVYRDLIVATHNGIKPDLYVVDRRSPRTRVRVVLVSGESGFKDQLVNSYLPIRGAGPRQWALDMGPIAARPVDDLSQAKVSPSPDLMLVEHNPDDKYAIVRVALGEDSYQGFAFQRAMDAPGRLPPKVHFLLGAFKGATTIWMVETDGGGRSTLSIFPLEPPAGFY